jgi:hypothetical protein
VEQFTTKLLADGRIIGLDNSGLGTGVKGIIGKVRREFWGKTFGGEFENFGAG